MPNCSLNYNFLRRSDAGSTLKNGVTPSLNIGGGKALRYIHSGNRDGIL